MKEIWNIECQQSMLDFRENTQCNAELKSIFILQKDYIEHVGRKFSIENCIPISTPLPQGVDYSAISRLETDEEKAKMANYPYHELIGSLMFASVVSCPNIAHSVNKLAQYSSNQHYLIGN
jgi:hypothetical protein